MAAPNYVVLHRSPNQLKYKIKSMGKGNRRKHWQAYLDSRKLPGQSRFVTLSSTLERKVRVLEVGESEYNKE